ncbi:MAG: response regulator [Cyclobacteriaceae bacterium]
MKKLFLLQVGILIELMVFAQKAERLEFIPIQESLTQNTVTCIAQDGKGFLWIGTRNGLNKYDGLNMINYEPGEDESKNISNGEITALYKDQKGVLWIGTTDHGLNMYDSDTDSFISFLHSDDDITSISENYITRIFEDQAGVLWVGTEGRGLNSFDKDRKSFKRFLRNADDPFSISGNQIMGIAEDDLGNLWVGTRENGINLYDRNSKRFIRYFHDESNPNSINSNVIWTLSKGQNGNIWIGTDEGLNRLSYKHDTYTFENVPFDNMLNEKTFNVVLSVIEDSKNRLWIGTENGGLIMQDLTSNIAQKYVHDARQEYSISSNSVWSLFEDSYGSIWVGTFNEGLVKVNNQSRKFRHVKNNSLNPNSLIHNSVSCFEEDSKGNIWIGTDGGGINYWDQKSDVFKLFNASTNHNINNDQVLSMLIDYEGNLLVGFWRGGVRILKKGKNRFEKLEGNHDQILHDGSIFSLMQDSQNRIWIGSHSDGLVLYNPKDKSSRVFRNEQFDSLSLSNDMITCIKEDSYNNIWVGTNGGGLNRVVEDAGRFAFHPYELKSKSDNGLSSNYIFCVLEDSDKNIWIGTANKLNKYRRDSDSFISFGKAEGLPNNVINGMLQDEEGNLWISTNKGLAKFNEGKNVTKSYTIFDGLQSNEFFRQSCFERSNGEFLFGGIKGFNIFNPNQIYDNTHQPTIYITNFKISNKDVDPGPESPLKQNISNTEEITLSYDQNNFSFEFATLSFSQSKKNTYAYQLRNYDDDWQYVGNQRTAHYTGVPPGEYIFEVKGTNNDGVWSNKIATIKTTITPAWYRTFWSYAIYLIIFVSILWWGTKTLINREKLQAQYQMEHLELSKMQELDEMKSRFFANISHEFRSPLTLILGPLKGLRDDASSDSSKEQFSLMIRNAESLLSLINQLLELSKLESGKMKLEAAKDDVVNFLKPIVKSFSSIANKKYISYSISMPDEPIEVYYDDEKLEKIVVNLLSNAFKYTPEFGKVGFEVLVEGKNFVIKVSDSGIGVPEDEAKYIFNRYYRVNNRKETRNKGTGIGLSLTQELVQLHSGKIKLISKESKGALFKVLLPLGNEHLKPEQIVEKKTEYKSYLKEFYQDAMELDSKLMNETMERIEHEMNDLPLILIVEDSEDIRKYIKQTLEQEYRVVQAENGKEGVEIAQNEIPDLVISDIMMPVMDGFEVCRKLKGDVKTSHIPIILLTAKASNESTLVGFEQGADYYITKPFNPKLLMLRVKNILKTRDQIKGQLLNKNTLNIEPKNVKIPASDQDFLDKAIAIIQKNISNSEFFVDDLGREMGLSRMQLYRKLKALIGQSANEFIRFIRLKRAAQLLDQGTLNISEITYEVGFNDLKYFRDCFKKQYGVSPSDYSSKPDSVAKKGHSM